MSFDRSDSSCSNSDRCPDSSSTNSSCSDSRSVSCSNSNSCSNRDSSSCKSDSCSSSCPDSSTTYSSCSEDSKSCRSKSSDSTSCSDSSSKCSDSSTKCSDSSSKCSDSSSKCSDSSCSSFSSCSDSNSSCKSSCNSFLKSSSSSCSVSGFDSSCSMDSSSKSCSICSSSSSDSSSCSSGSSDSSSCSSGSSDSSSCSSSSSSSCSCDASKSFSCDDKKDKLTVDLATSNLCFFPTKKVFECGNFVGSRGVGKGYIYEGCTICCCSCKPFCGCGAVCDKPEYPRKVIGTYDVEFTIVNPEFNRALAYLFTGHLKKYLQESQRLAGRVLMETSLRLSFSDSSDFYLPSVDTLLISGRVPWGVKGQEWLMSVNGGTGDYKTASGQAEVERLIVANGSRTRLGESWRLSLDVNTLIEQPPCNK